MRSYFFQKSALRNQEYSYSWNTQGCTDTHLRGLNWPAIETNTISGPCSASSVNAESREPIVNRRGREDPNQNIFRSETEAEARPCCITLEYNPPLQSTLFHIAKVKAIRNQISGKLNEFYAYIKDVCAKIFYSIEFFLIFTSGR